VFTFTREPALRDATAQCGVLRRFRRNMTQYRVHNFTPEGNAYRRDGTELTWTSWAYRSVQFCRAAV